MRKPMITRTMTNTKVTVLALDVNTAEPQNITTVVPRTYKDDVKLMKVIKEQVETETLKAVHIVSKEEVETLYGMSEADFLKYAQELDPATRKAIETADEAEETEEN